MVNLETNTEDDQTSIF